MSRAERKERARKKQEEADRLRMAMELGVPAELIGEASNRTQLDQQLQDSATCAGEISATEKADGVAELPTANTLYFALQRSGFYMAARYIQSRSDVVVVSNGQRFWTALLPGFEPMAIPMFFDDAVERTREDWFPIQGNETGWRIGQ